MAAAAAARAAPAATDDRIGEDWALAQLFGFVQLEFAGALAVADGRYLARSGGEGAERVLVLQTIGARPRPERRRLAREVEAEAGPPSLSLARATVVLTSAPFDSAEGAESWLATTAASEEARDALVEESVGLVNRALHASAVASADALLQAVSAERAERVRIGYGDGEDLARGLFAVAQEAGPRRARVSRRRRREEELPPQERVAAVLGGRERLDACETLVLRARADLGAGRPREAALQLRIGLDALLVELAGALASSGHEQDMAQLEARRGEAREAAEMALEGDLDDDRKRHVAELLDLCERVLRRRRLLRG